MNKFSLPTLFTFCRMAIIPLLIFVFYMPYQWKFYAASALFSIAAITDWLDGYLARRYSQSTRFGAFLDPVADKLVVVVALVLLIEQHATPLLAIPAMVIICREVAISALREWMAEIGKRSFVAVTRYGKYKTASQITALILLLLADPASSHWLSVLFLTLGYLTLYVAALLTLVSMFGYLRAAWPFLNSKSLRVDQPSEMSPLSEEKT